MRLLSVGTCNFHSLIFAPTGKAHRPPLARIVETDYPTVVRLIAETTTRTGLQVNCALSTKDYPTKIKISDEQMRELDLIKHPTLPDWNYTLFPRINRN